MTSNYKRLIGVGARGFLMGMADLVPGISGGTIAFVTGIYEELFASIKSINKDALTHLLSCRIKIFFQVVRWKFLLALVGGMTLAIVSSAQLLHGFLGDPVARTYLYSFFLGLILASILFCFRTITAMSKALYVAVIIGATVAYLVTTVSFFSGAQTSYDVQIDYPIAADVLIVNYDVDTATLFDVTEDDLHAMLAKRYISLESRAYDKHAGTLGVVGDFIAPSHKKIVDGWMVVCGMLAISAMLLPGISGSYILTILGEYPAVIGATANVVMGLKHGRLDIDALMLLGSLFIGILIGVVIFSRVVSMLLQRWHDMTIATLVGFMIGSLKAVWPFWTMHYVLHPLTISDGPQIQLLEPLFPSVTNPQFAGSAALFVIGMIFVISIEKIAAWKKNTGER